MIKWFLTLKKFVSLLLVVVFFSVSNLSPVFAADTNSYKYNGITYNKRDTYNILEVSKKDKIEIQEFLEKQEKVPFKNKLELGYAEVAASPAVVSVYFIPGIGEVALLVTGAIVVGGVTYYAGSWLYDKIMPYIIGFSIPNRLKKDGNTVDLGKFNKKVKGKEAYKEDGGWYIEKDTAGHGGSKWKLKDRKGNRVASLDEKGKILRK
ncbi:hypothetical protein ACETAC_01880 [Aceticella autotrophica]|uniref:Uncharacterized protein n=1 Tax=Aceticella autotrophica TaxID=2755338 RepID=A0A975AWG0_9THEO|nr:hypothetical protein [Aceticella autotrophica]QSZ27678.1 hypothetical protein ACETAC_01880 [Aceticella autotrophica]